jgi:hypothetical protein
VKVFKSAKSVVDATVIDPPSDTEVPFIVIDELERSVFATLAQVPTPEAERERTNWLVQDVPAYAEPTPDVVRTRPVAEPSV